MTDPEARIRVDFSQGELEIEGTESFVERNLELIEELEPPSEVEKNSTHITNGRGENGNPPSSAHVSSKLPKVPDHFGEWFHIYNDSDLTQVDQALIAGYYVQYHSEQDEFTTGTVDEVLSEVNINLTNTSDSIQRLIESGRAYKTQEESNKQHYRVSSREGYDYLEGLIEDE